MSSPPTPPPPRAIAEKMAKGAGWLIFLRFMVRGTGIISTLILARLLLPADFGLVSLAMSLAEGIEAMGALGLQLALIRQPTISRPLYDTAFTITLLRNLVSAAILAALAPWSAEFFGDERLALILYVIAMVTALQGLENIGIVSFRKELQFEKEVLIFIIPKLVAFVVTLTLAYLLRDYRALLVGIVCQRLTRTALSYIMDSYRPRLTLSAWRELLKFSAWIWLTSVANFIKERSDAYVLGRALGPAPLGIFRVGMEIASLPSTEMVQPICRALFSGFARAENTGVSTRAIFTQSMGLVLAIILPIAMGLSLCAEPLVLVALGPNWVEAIPVIQILGAVSVLTVVGEVGSMALIAIGRPAASTAMVVVGAVIRLPLIIYGTHAGRDHRPRLGDRAQPGAGIHRQPDADRAPARGQTLRLLAAKLAPAAGRRRHGGRGARRLRACTRRHEHRDHAGDAGRRRRHRRDCLQCRPARAVAVGRTAARRRDHDPGRAQAQAARAPGCERRRQALR